MLEADDFLGKIVIGKVSSGSIRLGQPIKVLNTKGEKIDEGSVIKILAKRGLQRLLRDNGAFDEFFFFGFNFPSLSLPLSILQPFVATSLDWQALPRRQ